MSSTKDNKLIKLSPLRKGDTIGIIAPGSPAHKDRVASGVRELEERGFAVKIPIDPSSHYGRYDHLFGSESPAVRAQAIHQLVKDPAVKLILAARGGYGSLEVLPLLDFKLIQENPKFFVGYSDVTALLNAITSKTGLVTIHGSTLSKEFSEAKTEVDSLRSVEALLDLLEGKISSANYSCSVMRKGIGRGHLVGGNLTVLQTLIGTPWEPVYDGGILVLEEVDEAPYRVHRALLQLRASGRMERLQGLVFGRFSKCAAKHGPGIAEVLEKSLYDIFAGYSFPILNDLEFGHNGVNLPIAIGCQGKITEDGLLTIESPIGL
jgi:muramoyltetrapeptide carboxypeptidase